MTDPNDADHADDGAPGFWRQATHGDWAGALANLRNFGDDYGPRRTREADLLEAEIKAATLPAPQRPRPRQRAATSPFHRSLMLAHALAMRVEPFRPRHLSELILQPHQRAWQGRVSAGHARLLGRQGQAWTGLSDDGRVAACAGVLERGEGRGLAWALLAADVGPAGFVALHRAVARTLAALPYRRIEAHVAADFAAGRRWARLLGFVFEGVMRGYQADGSDALLFARLVAAADRHSNAGP